LNMEVLGVVLAGGSSSRFGDRDKTVVEVGDEPMVSRAVHTLEPAVDRLVVSCRTEQRGRLESALEDTAGNVSFVYDPVPDTGPAGGLRASVEGADEGVTAVMASDMPLVPSRVIRSLLDELDEGVDCAVPVVGGHPQPLAAVYRTTPLREYLRETDEQAVLSTVNSLNCRTVDAERWGTELFINVNTAKDLTRARNSVCRNGG